ncbi:MAG TPA: zf-HC2 domain-containing protein [Verrucomicrobiae bacterium]|nr:zf-HC2 domain-containing protein [Verrucomicrobiae bacterium]
MKPHDQPCRQHRQDVSLLAAGALSSAEQAVVQKHLSSCPACQEYFVQIKAVTMPLAAWVERLPQVGPSQAAQQRWTKAIRAAGQSASVHKTSPFQLLWQKLILPNRHTWASLATVWILLVAFNLALRNQSPASDIKPMTASAVASYGEQQKLLNEMFADRSPAVDADRPKNYSPKPRTEKFRFATA